MATFSKRRWLAALGPLFFAGTTALYADNAADLEQAGMALFRAGQYGKSIQYFNSAVAADPNDWQAYEDMGNAYMKLSDKANALSAYQKALALDPNDTTLQTLVDNLNTSEGTGTEGQVEAPPGPPASSQPGDDSAYNPPDRSTTIIVRHPRRRWVDTTPTFNDGLAPMDHARIWTSVSLGYSFAAMTDLMNGVSATNQVINDNGYSGLASMTNSGVEAEFQLGFLLNPNNGIAIGLGYIRQSDLNENIDFNNGPPDDFQDINLQPQVVPLTIDYFLFLPDKGGRFFLSAGAGVYFGDIKVDNNFDFTNSGGSADDVSGDLTSTTVGFQLAVGREFAVTDRIGLTVFAKGRYAKLSNFQGTLTDPSGASGQFGLAIDSDGTVDVPNTSQIGGASGNRYADVDFTGFDVGFALNFYTF